MKYDELVNKEWPKAVNCSARHFIKKHFGAEVKEDEIIWLTKLRNKFTFGSYIISLDSLNADMMLNADGNVNYAAFAESGDADNMTYVDFLVLINEALPSIIKLYEEV